ncbi:MAG: hypothetical protein HFI81_07165 [Eubacterium sp.]|nr:hypothetical protein [Eubacterium sp.]
MKKSLYRIVLVAVLCFRFLSLYADADAQALSQEKNQKKAKEYVFKEGGRENKEENSKQKQDIRYAHILIRETYEVTIDLALVLVIMGVFFIFVLRKRF